MRKLFILFLLLTLIADAQVPQKAPLTIERLIKLVGELQIQIAESNEYIAILQNKIVELDAENKKLKESK